MGSVPACPCLSRLWRDQPCLPSGWIPGGFARKALAPAADEEGGEDNGGRGLRHATPVDGMGWGGVGLRVGVDVRVRVTGRVIEGQSG